MTRPSDTEAVTKVLLAHQLFYDESEDANECGCGERAPQEFIENYPHDWEAPNTPDAAWWAGHVADLLETVALAERDSAMDQLGTSGHALVEARRRLATYEDEFPAVVRQRDALQAQLDELRAARLAGAGAQVTEAAVTDDAIEAAAEAMGPSRDCECTLDSDTCNVCYATVRAALTAALPHLGDGLAEAQAQALEDAADAMEAQRPPEGYVVVYPERLGAWLRDRAASLRPAVSEGEDE